MTMILPPGFFYLRGILCVRLHEGGWRQATATDKAECEAKLEAARKRVDAESKAAAK